MSCWDTSAFIKLYVQEEDSDWFDSLADRDSVVIAPVGLLEAQTVLHRRCAEGAIAGVSAAALFERLKNDVASDRIRLQVETEVVRYVFGQVLEKCFAQIPPVFVRTNDALHIASAIVSGEETFATTDHRQRAAAELMGLKLVP